MPGAVDTPHPANGGPLPLVLGITGHRDLREADVAGLEARVGDLFAELRARYPHTPLILLSPLAEGADRLAARVALRMGVQLFVPLPMPRALYEEDFATADSRAEFAGLLQQADRWFELPVRRGVDEEQLREHTEQRDPQYQQVGIYIADHCHILIALWDGGATNGNGGTGQVVQYKLEGVPRRQVMHSTRSPLDPPETGPVYQIVTPRVSHPSTEDEPLSVRKRFPAREDHEEPRIAYERIYQRIEGFNQDSLSVASRLSEEQKQSKTYLLPGLDTNTLPAPFRALVDCYAGADTLARHFQRLTLNTLYGTMAVIFLMALLFDVYTELLRDKSWGHWVLLCYPIVWAAAYLIIYIRANRGDYQNKHQDYRALAEGLRVQFFWSLAELPDSVADHYLSKQRSELDWIRKALQFWKIGTEPEPAGTAGPLGGPIACLQQILTGWVADQAKWYANRARREHRKLERLEAGVRALVGLSMAVALMTALVMLAPGFLPHESELAESWEHVAHHAHGWLALGITMPAVIGALLHGYAEKQALSEHVKQYDRMSVLFANAKQRLGEALAGERLHESRLLLRELGREALAENGDWVLLHRQRPLEIPQAG
jgi:hypothetical protein